jgi:hypothetical protein
MNMKVETKLEIFEDYEEHGLEERVIKLAAQQLAATVGKVAEEIIREQVMKELGNTVAETFKSIIDEPVQTTNMYGEPKGPKKTLREVLVEQAAKYMSEDVDSSGKAARYHSDKKSSRLEYIARKAIREEWESVMKEEIGQIKAIANAELVEFKEVLRASMKK